MYQFTASAPVNIAVIKYWGKRDVSLNLPTNSSLSVTLDPNDMKALTTACAAPGLVDEDRLVLNGQEEPLKGRAQACIAELRHLREEMEARDASLPRLAALRLLLVSRNNFPTAAGLASSAAGFAALVRAVAGLYALPHSAVELSVIARQGSGSACRSLMGGYVAWQAGSREDGKDSLAVQIQPAQHWPGIRAAILVVSASKKDVSSTTGMQATVATSTLFPQRVQHVVPQRMEAMRAAIDARDFASFARITMQDSNQFHACCLDTYPPVFYMNDTSRAIVRVVHELNRVATAKPDSAIAAYTFDAGPNAVIYYEAENEHAVLGALYHATTQPGQTPVPGWTGREAEYTAPEIAASLYEGVRGGVSRVILTRVGEGARAENESLVSPDGVPV